MLALLTQNMFLILFGVLYPFILFLSINRKIKKVYNSNKFAQDLDVQFYFYNDRFEVKHTNGEVKIEYNMLNSIIETPTNFYLMVAQNQGYVISRDTMSNEFEEFIKNIKKRYM